MKPEEIIARSLCTGYGSNPDMVVLIGMPWQVGAKQFMAPTDWNQPGPLWECFLPEARAILKDLEERGLTIVVKP